MGIVRAYSPHIRWTADEVAFLHSQYAVASNELILAGLPGRSIRNIQSKANQEGLRRPKKHARTKEETLRVKREFMALRRASDPERSREYHRERHHKNRTKNIQKMRDYYGRRFFWGKAMKLRGDDRPSYKELASLWRKQRGRCALTNRRLGRSAHLDHIIAKARGGGDGIDNLRWVDPFVNLAKRDMPDSEWFVLCRDVVMALCHVEGME